MARVKEKAAKVKQLLADETFKAVMESVKNQQIAVFVDTGSSQEAREQLVHLAPEIEKTANLVQEIAMASLEQVAGVEQINNALQQLNTVTQRNAANSEQINTAAHKLESLAERLNQTLVKFKLDNN